MHAYGHKMHTFSDCRYDVAEIPAVFKERAGSYRKRSGVRMSNTRRTGSSNHMVSTAELSMFLARYPFSDHAFMRSILYCIALHSTDTHTLIIMFLTPFLLVGVEMERLLKRVRKWRYRRQLTACTRWDCVISLRKTRTVHHQSRQRRRTDVLYCSTTCTRSVTMTLKHF